MLQIEVPHTTAEVLRANMKVSIIGTELQHQEVQLRIVAVLLSGMMLFNFLDPAIFILNVPSSIIARVAMMTGEGSCVAWGFIGLSLMIVPYVVMNLFFPRHGCRRDCTKVACLGLAGAGLLWFLLAWASKSTDFPYVVGVYVRSGAGALAFAMTLALSLNNELARTLLDN